MPRNGTGSYTLPAGNPVVTGTTISSTWANTTLSDIGTALTNSLAKDGQTTPTANIAMGGFKLTGLGAGSAATDSANLGQIQAQTYALLSSVSGTNTLTANSAPITTAYAAGNTFRFVASGANTGPVTLNINSLGAKDITKSGTSALSAGDIQTGSVVEVVYDGTRFQILNPVTINDVKTTVASAATPDIWAASNVIDYTGTATATGFAAAPQAGAQRTLIAAAACSFTAGANLLIAGVSSGQTYTLAANDKLHVIAITTTQFLSYVEKYDGKPVVGSLTSGTSQASTSGTAINFTDIPSWAKKITIMLVGVSTNGTDSYLIQLGDSGGYETTGYLGASTQMSSSVSTVNATAGFQISQGDATNVIHGAITLSLQDAANNTWVATGQVAYSSSAAQVLLSGSKSTSATLDRLRVTTTGGTNTFDAGKMNILYE